MALLQTRDMSVTFGGLRAVNEVDLTRRAGPARRAHRSERRRQDDLHRRDHRLRADDRAHRASTAGRSAALPANKRAAAGPRPDLAVARAVRRPDGRPRTCRSRPSASRSASFLADLVQPRRSRDESGVEFALDVLGLRDLAGKMPNELSPGPAQAGQRRSGPGRPAQARVHGRAGGRPRHRRVARLWAPACGGSSTPASPSSSSTTTWAWCSTCATTSTSSSSGVVDRRRARRRDHAPTPRVIEAYLGESASEGAVTPDDRAARDRGDEHAATTACPSSATSTCTSTRARSSPCSARTAPARPRRC